jgi:molecular chaperone GrpE
VIDNLDRALSSVRRGAEPNPLGDGVALIHRQLMEELRREGLRPVEALGCPFDPALHEAVATESRPGLCANIVVEEIQRGYFRGPSSASRPGPY